VLRDHTARRGRDLVFEATPTLRYRLITDARDPVLRGRSDGAFHPMSVDAVLDALREIDLQNLDLQVEIFVLPYPRREVLDSSARDGMIFLAPGVRPVADEAVHFTVVHEIGHVFQYRWMPDADHDAWAYYARLRGIGDAQRYHAASPHRDRPHEIFAEDLRFLVGGGRANYSRSIENDELPLPTDVAGLDDFVRGLPAPRTTLATLRSVPNPFNPATELQVEFQAAPTHHAAAVGVFDARGRCVRRLFEGVPTAPALRLPWDGRTDDGAPVASGVYFARLEYRAATLTTKLLLVE